MLIAAVAICAYEGHCTRCSLRRVEWAGSDSGLHNLCCLPRLLVSSAVPE